MVECARLEIVYTGNRIKGSNPFVSATIKNHAQRACFFIVFDNVDSNPGQRVRTAAKRRTGVRRFARMRKFCQVMQRSEIIPSSPPGIIKCPTWGILLYPVKRNGANPSQSQIAGSTTSRFDQCNAVKSSRLPRSRCVCIVRGNTSSPPGIIQPRSILLNF